MPDRPIKIVIFTPTSQIHPAIGANIMAGARIALEEAGTRAGARKLELIERQLPMDPTKAPEVITRSVGTDRPDFIVAVLNSKIVARLREFCDLHRRFLIVATVGANITREAEMSPYIFRVSLNYWQSNYAMGQWLAGTLGKRIMAIPTMLDAGYDSYALFHAGVESAGGSVVRWYMADGANFTLNMPPVLEDVRNTRPDAVFALACGGKAISLVRAYKEAGLHKEFPLFVNSFAVEEPCLSALGDTAIGLKSMFSWADGLLNPGSARFRTSFLASAATEADSFSVLGYDAACLLVQASEAVGGDVTRKQEIISFLESASIDSPRGPVVMDARSHSAAGPIYCREVTASGEGLKNHVLQETPSMADNFEPAVAYLKGPGSGWFNEYLAI